MITSLTNPKIKKVIGLRDRRDRKKTGLTIVEGRRETARAVESGVPVKEIYVCRELFDKKDRAAVERLIKKVSACVEVAKPVFMKMAYGQRAEGVLAVCSPKTMTLSQLPTGPKPVFVIVEQVEKPGNFGAILRTCDGAGVDGVILCDSRTDPYNPNVIRASLGTVFTNRVVEAGREETLDFLRAHNITAYAATPLAKTVYTEETFDRAAAVIVGSEQEGLTDFWLKNADKRVKIPMKGKADSLNVSASAAVLLYEIIRQRNR